MLAAEVPDVLIGDDLEGLGATTGLQHQLDRDVEASEVVGRLHGRGR
jgi:hypothetical protein